MGVFGQRFGTTTREPRIALGAPEQYAQATTISIHQQMGSAAVSEKLDQRQTAREEILNALTHGVGIALSIAGLSVMVVKASLYGDALRIVSVSVFGASMVLLYSFSTLYHCFGKPSLKRVFRVLDHLSIYLLIAGTYTPFTLVSIRGTWGWSLFGVIWGLAFWGCIFKVFFTERLRILSVVIYLAMGWLCLVAFGPIVSVLSPAAVFWLAAGGVMYTLGVVFYAWQQLQFHHAVWHLFVLAGTGCHFLSVYYYVLPIAA